MPSPMPSSLKVALLALVAAYLVGCETLQKVFDGMEKPSVKLVGADLRGLTVSDVDIAFDVVVTNPYEAPLPLSAFAYELSSGGHDVVQGRVAPPQTIGAKQTGKVTLPVKVKFADVIAAAKGVRPGQVVPYDAKLDLIVTPPAAISDELTFPLRKAGKLPVPAIPEAKLAGIKWDQVDFAAATGEISLELKNTNAFDLGLEKLEYGLWLGGTRVTDITIDQGVRFESGKARTLTVPIKIRPADAGMALLGMLLKREAAYRLEGDLKAGTPYGPITFPLKASGTTTQTR